MTTSYSQSIIGEKHIKKAEATLVVPLSAVVVVPTHEEHANEHQKSFAPSDWRSLVTFQSRLFQYPVTAFYWLVHLPNFRGIPFAAD
jgi:hypothetical protein